jgi:outer membrane biogenesis lipoprotein LolB
MKRNAFFILVIASAIAFLTGCSWSVGGGPKTANVLPTTGQQLVDLKKAKDSGAITDAEYDAQKAKLLGNK